MVGACVYDDRRNACKQDRSREQKKRRGSRLISTVSSSSGKEGLYLRRKWGNRWRLGTRR